MGLLAESNRGRLMSTAYLGLGSNIGERERHLAEALNRLAEAGVEIAVVSSVYESPAELLPDQPDFLNVAAGVVTGLSPHALLVVCLNVERDMGRVREQRWGPRNIDIDLLLYGSEVVADPGLRVPHPGLADRSFVVVPLLEIAPDLRLPGGELLRSVAASARTGCLRRVSGPPDVLSLGGGGG